MTNRHLLFASTILAAITSTGRTAESPPIPTPFVKPAAPTAALISVLRGLRISTSPEGVDEQIKDVLQIDSDLGPLQNEVFRSKLRSYVGRPVTMDDLRTISQIITDTYRAAGQPFVRVTTPPQDITDGSVRYLVTPFRLGKLTVEGNRWFSTNSILSQCDLKPGDVLELEAVNADLNRLNGSSFRRVEALFSPGDETGTTDLILQTKDRLPVRVVASYDNAGSPSVGQAEWATGITWGDVFGLDQTASYQYMKSTSGRFESHSLSYAIPLPWHDQIQIQGSYSLQSPDVGSYMDIQGNSAIASLRYIRFLNLIHFSSSMTLNQSVQFGFDYKSTNNNLEFGGISIYAGQVEIDQFPLVYGANLTDKYGQTSIENTLVLSPGGLTANNNASAFRSFLPDARDTYFYDRISLTRTFFFSDDYSLTSRIIGQFSPHNLMYSEQLGLGGVSSVRGYYSNTATGSTGFLASNEFRAPPFSMAKLVGIGDLFQDQFQFGVYWDYGHAHQIVPIADTVNSATLSSVGLDFHLIDDRYLEIKFDIGWRLRRPPQGNTRGAFADFAISLSY